MTIRDELLALYDEDGLRPTEVVEWARENPDSALHKSLEWDDQKAGEQHRLWQVRRLISIHVVSETGQRQLVSLSIHRSSELGGGYRSLNTISSNREFQAVLLSDALKELERIQAKYDSLRELERVWNEVAKVKKPRRRSTAEQSAAQHNIA